MKETEKLKLKLPEENDYYDVNDVNENFEILDEAMVTHSDFNEFENKLIDNIEESRSELEGKIESQIGTLKFFAQDGILCIDDGEEN